MKLPAIVAAYILSLLTIMGCEKGPDVSFTANKSIAEVGEIVTFTNSSENSDEFIWDFGDSNASTDENPMHAYEEAGIFTVRLTAFGDGDNDSANETIEVVPATFNIEPGVRAGEFYRGDDLSIHFSKLDTTEMEYSVGPTTQGEYLHTFSFRNTGVTFYLWTPEESYTLSGVPRQIHVYPPFEGRAIGRLSFGSRLSEVTNVFGSPPFGVTPAGDYQYDGIIFYGSNSNPSAVDRIAVVKPF